MTIVVYYNLMVLKNVGIIVTILFPVVNCANGGNYSNNYSKMKILGKEKKNQIN